jgi:DNA polymerase I-like protein with 3'-5' exonuclease and polymerase domains
MQVLLSTLSVLRRQFVIPFCGGNLVGRGRSFRCPASLETSQHRIHAEWDFFTAVGRLSTRDPNVQTVFKDFDAAGDAFSLRSMFVAAGGRAAGGLQGDHDGGYLVAGDYSQMDLRVLAHLANDATLLAHLNSDCDVLRVVAGSHLKKDPQEACFLIKIIF